MVLEHKSITCYGSRDGFNCAENVKNAAVFIQDANLFYLCYFNFQYSCLYDCRQIFPEIADKENFTDIITVFFRLLWDLDMSLKYAGRHDNFC